MAVEQTQDPRTGEDLAPRKVGIRMSGGTPGADPDEAKVAAGQTLFWFAQDPDRSWAIMFKDDESPFQNKQLVFSGRGQGVQVGGPLRHDLEEGQKFPYSVIYQDDEGMPKVADPIIVVEDVTTF